MRIRGLPVPREDRLLLAAVVVELVVLALVPRVVTVDGPAHVNGGWVLAHLRDPVVQRYYEFDVAALPNLLTTVALAVLVTLAGTDWGEKLLVAGYVVLLPLALRYALQGVHPQAGWLAVAAVPFTFNYLFYFGFYNFCLGLVLCLFIIGLALRQGHGWSARAALGLTGLLALAWSTHLLPAAVAALLVGVLAVVRMTSGTAESVAVAARRHLLAPVLAGLPVLALTVSFLLGGAAEHGEPVRRPVVELAVGFFSLTRPLVVYSNVEAVPALLVAAVLIGLAVRSGRHRSRSPERTALAITTVLMVLAYFASPDRFGPQYGFLNDRLSFFPPLLLLVWTAAPPPSQRMRRAVVAGLLGAALALSLLRLPSEVRYQRAVDELLSVAPRVPAGSVLLQVQLVRIPPVGGLARNGERDPLRHESSRLAAATGSIDAGHYEAALDYFPVRFRAGNDLRAVVDPGGDGLDRVPPDIDLAAGTSDVDVVIVTGRQRANADVLDSPATRRTLAVLSERYRQTAVSSPTGLAEVWIRR